MGQQVSLLHHGDKSVSLLHQWDSKWVCLLYHWGSESARSLSLRHQVSKVFFVFETSGKVFIVETASIVVFFVTEKANETVLIFGKQRELRSSSSLGQQANQVFFVTETSYMITTANELVFVAVVITETASKSGRLCHWDKLGLHYYDSKRASFCCCCHHWDNKRSSLFDHSDSRRICLHLQDSERKLGLLHHWGQQAS